MDFVGSLIDKHPAWFTFACLSLGGFVWQGVHIWRGLASRRWPSVQGWVHRSTFGAETIVTRGGAAVEYVAVVEYTYRVGETEYIGRRRRFGFPPDAVEPQPHQGEWVTVWYNPGRPIEATLETGIRSENLVILFACIFGAVVALAMAARP